LEFWHPFLLPVIVNANDLEVLTAQFATINHQYQPVVTDRDYAVRDKQDREFNGYISKHPPTHHTPHYHVDKWYDAQKNQIHQESKLY